MNNGFKFYTDYFNLINTLPKLRDKEKIFAAIMFYMFEDKQPDLSGHNLAIFNTLKHQLDVSKNNSGRGGKPSKNKEEIKKQVNDKKIKNNKTDLITDLETDKHTDCCTDRYNKTSISIFYFLFSILNINNIDNKDKIYNLLNEYLEIRNKKKYIVNETIVKRLIKKLNDYGKTDEEKIKIIENAINGAWKDFYELKEEKKEYEQHYTKW